MTETPAPRLTIGAYRTRAEGGTQIQIAELGAGGTGWGRRLAGPKHYNMGTTTLVERDLDADDAREIRSMLDKVFPLAPTDPWQALADALNAAGALGIDLDGTITDHAEHSVVWDRAAERWIVAAYDEDAAPATEDGAL